MDNKTTVGQKIKQFRKRAGVSQMELEMRIDTSPGSISRIESGEVNPTKETLMKISKALQLTTAEVASLQDIQIFSPEEVMTAINKITNSLDLKQILKNAVDTLLDLYPNYNGGVILLIDEDNEDILRGYAVTDMPGITKVHKMLGKSVDKFPLIMSLPEHGLLVESVLTNEPQVSRSLEDFTRGGLSDYIAKFAAKVLGFKIGIAVPILFDKKVIGAMLYTKNVDEDFSEYEQKLLRLLSDQIGIAVMNGKYFEKIKQNISI